MLHAAAPDSQELTNNGPTQINVPYTLSIYSPAYSVISGSAWNWGATGSATAGTFSGPVTQARAHARGSRTLSASMQQSACFTGSL